MNADEPLIISYTREQAIADGVLIPIDVDLVEVAGFRNSEMAFGLDMMSNVRSEAEKVNDLRQIPFLTLDLMETAVRAIFAAEDKNTDKLAFDWRGYDCRISLFRHGNELIQWTIFRPSDD